MQSRNTLSIILGARRLVAVCCCALALVSAAASPAAKRGCAEPKMTTGPVRVLIVTGGHPYEPSQFFSTFNALPGITYQHVLVEGGKPIAGPLGGLGKYDVVLFYDLQHDAITPEWRALLDRGKHGLVFLHHAIGSFPLSPEFKSIAGGHANFFFGEYPDLPHSSVGFAKQHFTVSDAEHPVTCGLKNFDMEDEIYDDVDTDTAVHVLITSDGPKDSPAVVWTWSYAQKRVLYVQMGHGSLGLPLDHGPTAYENANFKRLLTRGILWAAGRL